MKLLGNLQKPTLTGDFRLYRRLLTYVMAYKGYFFAGIGFTVLYALTTPAIAALMKPLLDGSFVARDPAHIFWTPVLLLVLFGFRGITQYLYAVCLNWVMGRVVYDIQNQMIRTMLFLPTTFYDQYPTAQIVSRTTADVNGLTEAASTGLITIIRESLIMIGLLVWIFILDWVLSLTIVFAAPVIVLLVHFVARRLRNLHRQHMHVNAKFLHHLQEVTSYHRLVKLNLTQDFERNRLADIANNVRRLKLKQIIASAVVIPTGEFISATIIAGVVYFSLTRDMTDPLTVGGFVSYMAALALMSTALKRLLKVNEVLQKGLTAAERVFFIIDYKQEPETGDRGIDEAKFNGHTIFKNITFRYPNTNRDSLCKISLEIKAHQTIALVGTSGSGKSTLTALLPRLYGIQGGEVFLDDVDIREYKLSELRSLIAFVSQDVQLFDDTISVNIAYGNMSQATPERIKAAAKAANALEFIEKLPNGFDTVVGEKGIRLSGGQKQRIAIARAFIKDAPILILDEATSSLDTESEYQVRQALEELGQGRTVIIVAHRLTSIERVDRIIVLSEGQIVEDGNHQELMALKGQYHKLYTIYSQE